MSSWVSSGERVKGDGGERGLEAGEDVDSVLIQVGRCCQALVGMGVLVEGGSETRWINDGGEVVTSGGVGGVDGVVSIQESWDVVAEEPNEGWWVAGSLPCAEDSSVAGGEGGNVAGRKLDALGCVLDGVEDGGNESRDGLQRGVPDAQSPRFDRR